MKKNNRQSRQTKVDSLDARVLDKQLRQVRRQVVWLVARLGSFRALADAYGRPHRNAGWFNLVAGGSGAPRVDGIDALMIAALVASIRATSKASSSELYHVEQARKSAADALYHATEAARSIARRRKVNG